MFVCCTMRQSRSVRLWSRTLRLCPATELRVKVARQNRRCDMALKHAPEEQWTITINNNPLSWHRTERHSLLPPTATAAILNEATLARQDLLTCWSISGVQKIGISCIVFVAICKNLVRCYTDRICQLCWRFSHGTRTTRQINFLHLRHRCLRFRPLRFEINIVQGIEYLISVGANSVDILCPHF